MKKANKTFVHFIQKMRFKYRVSILNENTLVETWHVRLSRFSVFFYVLLFTFITFLLLTLLILNTPLRHYLPGYQDSGNRTAIMAESMRADSLIHQMELQSQYLDLIKQVIKGDLKAEAVQELDSIEQVKKMTEIKPKSKTEEAFLKNFEEKEKYNVAQPDPSQAPDDLSYVFFRPNRGTITSAFNLQERKFGIRMATTTNENILSVLSGTVVYAAYTLEWKWVIIVQHANDYLSVYKNTERLLKSSGQYVKAGESIAVGPVVSNNMAEQFYFELWKNGHAVNPEEYIIF